jgi:hypothetical protein
MVPAFTGAYGIAIATAVTITITVTVAVPIAVDGDAIGTDPYVGLRNRVVRRAGNPGESREGR